MIIIYLLNSLFEMIGYRSVQKKFLKLMKWAISTKKRVAFSIAILAGGVLKCSAFNDRPTLPDACPQVLSSPDNTFKLLFMTLHGVEMQCCGCNPGTYLDKLCRPDNLTTTTCRPCGPGTYMTEYAHGRDSCHVDDLVCPSGLIRIFAESDKAPRCDCPRGSYKTGENTCSRHTPCPPGEGVKILPTPFRDTECELCPSGYYSPRSSTTDGCDTDPTRFLQMESNCTVKDSPPSNTPLAVTSPPTPSPTVPSLLNKLLSTTSHPADCSKSTTNNPGNFTVYFILGGIFVGFVLGFIIWSAILLIWKRCKKRKVEKTRETNPLVPNKSCESFSLTSGIDSNSSLIERRIPIMQSINEENSRSRQISEQTPNKQNAQNTEPFEHAENMQASSPFLNNSFLEQNSSDELSDERVINPKRIPIVQQNIEVNSRSRQISEQTPNKQDAQNTEPYEHAENMQASSSFLNNSLEQNSNDEPRDERVINPMMSILYKLAHHEMTLDDAKTAFRFIVSRKSNNADKYLDDITGQGDCKAPELICRIFDKLRDILNDDFTLDTLHECFVNDLKNIKLAETLKRLIEEQEAKQP